MQYIPSFITLYAGIAIYPFSSIYYIVALAVVIHIHVHVSLPCPPQLTPIWFQAWLFCSWLEAAQHNLLYLQY